MILYLAPDDERRAVDEDGKPYLKIGDGWLRALTARETWEAGGTVLVIRPTWAAARAEFVRWCSDAASYRRSETTCRSEAGGLAIFMVADESLVPRSRGLSLDGIDGLEYVPAWANPQLRCRLRGPLAERAA